MGNDFWHKGHNFLLLYFLTLLLGFTIELTSRLITVRTHYVKGGAQKLDPQRTRYLHYLLPITTCNITPRTGRTMAPAESFLALFNSQSCLHSISPGVARNIVRNQSRKQISQPSS